MPRPKPKCPTCGDSKQVEGRTVLSPNSFRVEMRPCPDCTAPAPELPPEPSRPAEPPAAG